MSTTNEPSKNAQEGGKASAFTSWIDRLVHVDPVQMVSDIWDALDMWRATRRWSPIQMMIPGLVLFFSCFVTICFGMLTSNIKKLDRYIKKADTVAPIQDGLTDAERKAATKKATSNAEDITKAESAEVEDSPQAKAKKKADEEEEAKNIAYADLLFRRVLQLEPNNKMAKFFVAYNLGLRGNIDQARGMMQGLAPSDSKGYPRAHGWVAMDMYNQMVRGLKPDLKEMSHHLAIAADFAGTSALLLSVYAQLLDHDGKFMEGISMMQRAAQRDNAFYLPLSAMQAKHNQPIQAKESAESAIKHYKRSFGTKDEPDIDRVKVAEAYIQANNFDEAINVLQEGLRLREDRPLLRRALSNVFRYRYKSLLKRTEEGKIEANLGMLNSAMLADPTNPAVGQEIAMLQSMGVTADEDMVQALKKQLSHGGATAVTHLLLGNACMNKEDTQNAIFHWKLALGQDNNLVLAINNLAVVNSMLNPPKFDEALQLIDRAIAISHGYPEFLDSKGEILMRAERYEEAIAFLEKAKEGDPTRITTREKLVTCYEKVGKRDLADENNNVIAKIREFLKSKGLDDRGASLLRRLPSQSDEKTKDGNKSPEPALNFDDLPLPSQQGNTSPKESK
jgi:tetratricopeptide (TPR) repeat protein